MFLAAALLIGGCGGDDSSETNSNGQTTVASDQTAEGTGDSTEGTGTSQASLKTSSLPKKKYVEKAGKICEAARDEFNKEFFALVKRTGKDKTSVDPTTVVTTIFVPVYETMVLRIREMGAPADDKTKVATFLSAMEDALELALEKPEKTFTTEAPFLLAFPKAKVAGLETCAFSLV